MEIAILSEKRVIECGGIDLNVYSDDKIVHIVGYPMNKNEDGFWVTNAGLTLFSIATNLDPLSYTFDGEWYGWSGDADEQMGEDIDPDIVPFVHNVLKEVML